MRLHNEEQSYHEVFRPCSRGSSGNYDKTMTHNKNLVSKFQVMKCV